MTINDAIDLLKFYNGPFGLKLHPGADEALIKKTEYTYGISLPHDFKTLYRFSNGFEIDEDILNMIPLEEMISNKKGDEPIWIAEYMIYCDMWWLEINPDNPDDYSISGGDMNSGKTILTNSLAEFVVKFLKGGVFEKGGLYHWRDEIEAKIYGNTKPDDVKRRLAVFCECLKLDVISEQHVIQWADWIISTEYEPDPFFTQISLSRDLDELLTVLNSIDLPEDILQVRATFGEAYIQFLTQKMTSDKALSILEKFSHIKEFTPYEVNEIQYLLKEGKRFRTRFNKTARIKIYDRIKAFFDNYRSFNFYHCTKWSDVNSKIVEDFSAKEVDSKCC